MAKTPIRDIIEILSQHAEECMDLLGSVVPMFLTTDKEDNVHYFFIPPGISKTRAIKAMKELVEETEAVQCVFVDEAWMLERSCDVSREQIEEEASKPLENNPDSIEIILFSAECEDEGYLVGRRNITRPEGGGRPYLEPMQLSNVPKIIGSLTGLLKMEKETDAQEKTNK